MAYTLPMSSPLPPSSQDSRLLAQQTLSRAAGAPLIEGNAAQLLIDAAANYDAWLEAIGNAKQRVLLENYIVRDDETGRLFLAALVERA
jgi:cardiolipin synthase